MLEWHSCQICYPLKIIIIIIIIIIATETAIYKKQRGITKIHDGYGSYTLHVVLFCLLFVCYFIKMS